MGQVFAVFAEYTGSVFDKREYDLKDVPKGSKGRISKRRRPVRPNRVNATKAPSLFVYIRA